MDLQFHPEQIQHLNHLCRYLEHLLKCPVQSPQAVENGFLIAQINTSSFMGDILVERENIKRLSSIIPLVFSGWHTFDVEEARILCDVLQKFGFEQSIAILVLFDDQNVINSVRTVVVDKMRAYGIDVIVMGRQEIEKVLDDPSPSSAFRSFLLSGIDIARISPYEIAGPVSEFMFSGREVELRTITEGIGKRNYFLVGGRLFGKTSIMRRLNLFRLPAMGLYSTYYSLESRPTVKQFLHTRIHEWQPESPVDFSLTFADLLENQQKMPFIVLLLDETDKLIPIDRANEWQLFGKLRALANSGNIQLIFSGERTLREAIRDPNSPFFNFAHEMTVGPLDSRAAEELITRPMKQLEIELENEKEITDYVYEFTSGHPNIIQRLCHRLVKNISGRDSRLITLDDVNVVIRAPGFQRDDFLSIYWQAATSLEKIISLLIAQDGSLRTLRNIRQALNKRCGLQPKARSVDNALQRLVDLRVLLKRTPNGYEFAVKSFPRVVARTMTLDDMLEILTEEYQEQSE